MIRNFLIRTLPSPLYAASLIYRRAPIWRKAGFLFVHVPKNGGTSLNSAIYGQFMGHVSVRELQQFGGALLRDLPSLAIARNPWARLYSAYKFARRGRQMMDGAQIFAPERYLGPEFETFERFVFEWLDGRELSKEDYVFRAQTDFILAADGSIGVDHLGRLENPTTYLDFVESNLERKLNLHHLNSTTGHKEYEGAYTPEMKDVVARNYSKDLSLFQYEF